MQPSDRVNYNPAGPPGSSLSQEIENELDKIDQTLNSLNEVIGDRAGGIRYNPSTRRFEGDSGSFWDKPPGFWMRSSVIEATLNELEQMVESLYALREKANPLQDKKIEEKIQKLNARIHESNLYKRIEAVSEKIWAITPEGRDRLQQLSNRIGEFNPYNSKEATEVFAVIRALTGSDLVEPSLLPNEVMLEIFKPLSFKEIVRLRRVNPAFRDLANAVLVDKINETNPNFSQLGLHTKDQIINFLKSLGKDSCQGIERLSLAWTSIDDDFLKELSKLTPNLQSLDLKRCRLLTNQGVAHLTSFSWLQSLDLTECIRLTDGGLTHLASLTQLQHLDLFGNYLLTDGAKSRLKSLNPGLRIRDHTDFS